MPRCAECGSLVSVHTDVCPHCGSDEAEQNRPAVAAIDRVPGVAGDDAGEFRSSGPRVPIARFQNGAEAGYFADELSHQLDIDAEVRVREQFDAVHAIWTTEYVLCVPEEVAESASDTLQQIVSSTDDDSADGPEGTDESRSATTGAQMWVPLILTLAAGSIAYWGLNRLERAPRPGQLVIRDRRLPAELWQMLGNSRGPWVQKEGGVTRSLHVNPHDGTARVEEDHDGDGQFERAWEYSWR